MPRALILVEAKKRLADRVTANTDGGFDFTVHGPNGFLRRIAGKITAQQHWWSRDVATPEVVEGYDDVEVKVSTDSAFVRRFAGRVETGRDSVSDPALCA